MRVITGSARGKKLEAPAGTGTRPTSDRAKEAVFSAVGDRVRGARVLDLFAGSGQLGIEALSRGAKQAVFVDLSQKSLDVVKQNLKKTHLIDRAELHKMAAEQFIAMQRPESYDIVLLDPPYRMDILGKILPLLAPLVRPGGAVIAEHEKNCILPEKILNLRLQKEYFYGKIVVSVMKLNEEVEP